MSSMVDDFEGEVVLEAPAWVPKRGRDASEVVGAAAKQARKEGHAGKKLEQDTLQKLVVILAHLCLTNAAQVRDLTGAVFTTVVLESSHAVAKACKDAGAAYHEKAKEDPKGHGMGPPFLHVWLGLLQALIELPTTEKSAKVTIAFYWKEFALAKPREHMEQHIRHCRMKPTFNKDKMKLSVAFSAEAAMLKPEGGLSLERAVIDSL